MQGGEGEGEGEEGEGHHRRWFSTRFRSGLPWCLGGGVHGDVGGCPVAVAAASPRRAFPEDGARPRGRGGGDGDCGGDCDGVQVVVGGEGEGGRSVGDGVVEEGEEEEEGGGGGGVCS